MSYSTVCNLADSIRKGLAQMVDQNWIPKKKKKKKVPQQPCRVGHGKVNAEFFSNRSVKANRYSFSVQNPDSGYHGPRCGSDVSQF